MDNCLRKNEVSTTDHKDMIQFTKYIYMFFSGPGLHIRQRFGNEVYYYKEVERSLCFFKNSEHYVGVLRCG